MDTYLYDSPPKAFTKWGFLLLTYAASIFFKEFTLEIIMPTVFLYFLSNIADYADIAFIRNDKVKVVKNFALGIFIVMVICAVLAFAVWNSNKENINIFMKNYYGIVYIVSSIVWAIPLIDGIKSQTDKNRQEAIINNKKVKSDIAFEAMKQSIYKSNE